MGTLIYQISVAVTETNLRFLTKQRIDLPYGKLPTSVAVIKGDAINMPKRETFRMMLKYEL